ncbi:MAG: hypothetical protein ACFE85_01915 [Candidatus Hodarchaeota archaeon]
MNSEAKRVNFKGKIDDFFHKIFSPNHIMYTIVFFLVILIITILSFSPSPNLGNIVLFFATTFSLTFLILMIIGIFPQSHPYLLSSDKKFEPKKIVSLTISLVISFIITLIYFLLGSSSQLPIEFLGWDFLLPSFFIIIYFGWNLIQIFFLRILFEDFSIKLNERIIQNEINVKNNEYKSAFFLIVSLVIPILIQLGTLYGFIPFFEPLSPSDPIDSLYWFYGWNIAMFLIILLISWRLIVLFIKGLKNGTPNIFLSIFHILIWFYIWYKSFSFIYSFRTATQALGVDIFRVLIDILLMSFTAILVLKGLGDKLYKFKIFNENNISFFLFAFTILYIEGQVIMILGAGSISGTYTSRSQINLVNNFLILLVALIFYWWYSEYILERKGLIFKKNFKKDEVINIVSDFKSYLENSGALDTNKISKWEFENFLIKKKLKSKKEKEPISKDTSVLKYNDDINETNTLDHDNLDSNI